MSSQPIALSTWRETISKDDDEATGGAGIELQTSELPMRAGIAGPFQFGRLILCVRHDAGLMSRAAINSALGSISL
jgi:hypothetical protein